MKNKQVKLIGAAVLSLILTGVAVTTAFAAPAATTLTASVVSQACNGGNDVNVVLTAVLSPARSGVTYAWDFNGDGILDTAADANPTVTAVYTDEVVATATVFVMKGAQTKGSDSITFQTVRCP